MNMLTKQRTSAKELVQKWVEQQTGEGKTAEELQQTMFVYGDEVMEIEMDESRQLQIKEKQESDIVIFRKAEPEPGHICRCCSMEHDTHKDSLQCCAYLD